jgi:hypothetical protein
MGHIISKSAQKIVTYNVSESSQKIDARYTDVINKFFVHLDFQRVVTSPG